MQDLLSPVEGVNTQHASLTITDMLSGRGVSIIGLVKILATDTVIFTNIGIGTALPEI